MTAADAAAQRAHLHGAAGPRSPRAPPISSPIFSFAAARIRSSPDSDTLLRNRPVRDLLAGVLGCSPYLSGLVTRDPARLLRILETAPEARLQTLAAGLEVAVAAAPSFAEAMRALRLFKAEVALLVALCDLGGVWPVMQVTAALTAAADAAVAVGGAFPLRPGRPRVATGWAPDAAAPERAPATSCSAWASTVPAS